MPKRKAEEVLPRAAFAFAVSCSQLLGLGVMVMTGIWMGKYGGGFAWDGSKKQLNYHPFFMVIGMIFLNAEALMSYRIFRYESKTIVKFVHLSLQTAAFLFAVIALLAVFSYHNHNDIPNIATLHGWVGLVLITLFGLQLVFGFIIFIIPGVPDSTTALYIRIHKFFGVSFFVMSVGNCMVGIVEYCIYFISNYTDLGIESLLANFLGLSLIVFCVTVIAVIIPDEFRRPTEKERAIMMLERYDSD